MKIIQERTQTKDHFTCQTLHSNLYEAEVAETEQELESIRRENTR